MTFSDNPQAAHSQTNAVNDIRFGDGDNTFNFAPVQIGTQIETQIIQIATEKVTQRSLIKASPYRGLKRFNFADRDWFFGRDASIKRPLESEGKVLVFSSSEGYFTDPMTARMSASLRISQ